MLLALLCERLLGWIALRRWRALGRVALRWWSLLVVRRLVRMLRWIHLLLWGPCADRILLLVLRLCHAGFEQGLVVSPCFDELLVQLREVVWRHVRAGSADVLRSHLPFFCEYFPMSSISFGLILSVR